MTYQPPAHGWRTFWIVWLTQSLSAFGSNLTFFAITIWLTQVLYPRPEQKPELAFAISAISLAGSIPAVFGAPLAGAWADRHDRKRTMMVVDFIGGVGSLGLMILIGTNQLNLILLIPLVVVFSFLGSFHWSAFNTSYAMIVPAKHLPRANGMMQTTEALAGILAPAAAATLIALPALARQGAIGGALGVLLATLDNGSTLALAIDALTFFIAAGTLLFLLIPSPLRDDLQAGKPKISIWADARAGAVYIWRRQPMLWLLGTFTMVNFAGAPSWVLQPLLVKFNLSQDWSARGFTYETALALINTAAAIGGVAGGFAISAWGGLKSRRIYGVLIPMIAGGVAQSVLGWSPLFYVAVAMGFIRSVVSPLMNAHSQAIWQTQTPHELQGRVFAVRRLIAQFTFPLGAALSGWAGGALDVGWLIAIFGAVMTVFCIVQLFNPYLRRVEDKAWLEKLAMQAEEKQLVPAK